MAELHKKHPDNPECIFLSALILADDPKLKQMFTAPCFNADPYLILLKLVETYPEKRIYQYELIRLAGSIKLTYSNFDQHREHIEKAIVYSEMLLAVNPTDVILLNDTVKLYEKLTDRLLSSRRIKEANTEINRVIGVMKLLNANPHTPEEAKEALLIFLEKQIKMARRFRRNNEYLEGLLKNYKEILQKYNGPRKKEFSSKIKYLAN